MQGVAPPRAERGLKFRFFFLDLSNFFGRSASRGAWIEMPISISDTIDDNCRSASRGAWIEMSPGGSPGALR